MVMVINKVKCRSILNKSGIPGIDYAINPYVGCGHKCQYCYAVFMKRFSGHTEPWGDFIDVKTNAPEILERQLERLKKKSHISFSTVCDAYQPIEVKYRITQKCLEILAHYRHSVSILTKSPLVLRDADLLRQFGDVEVGFTVTTFNKKVRRIFEPGSSSPEKRFAAIRILSKKSIPTWVFVAPTLPCFSDTQETLHQIFSASQDAGAGYIMFDTLNPYPKVWNNVMRLIRRHFPELEEFYEYYYNNKEKYGMQLKRKISQVARGYKIRYTYAF